MNPRIRELYRQAHMVREYPLDDPMRGGNPPTVYWGGERSAERFAELIVKECAEICMEEFDTGLLMAPQAPWVAKQIKQHFGVE